MRFFTRAWVRGELPDDLTEGVPAEYRAHLRSLDLPPPLAALADVYLHDGKLLDIDQSGDRLSLRLRVGDLQRGYADLRLDYNDASLGSRSLAALNVARESETEVLYAEVGRNGGQFEHKMLLWPDGDITITFTGVRIASTPVANRSVG